VRVSLERPVQWERLSFKWKRDIRMKCSAREITSMTSMVWRWTVQLRATSCAMVAGPPSFAARTSFGFQSCEPTLNLLLVRPEEHHYQLQESICIKETLKRAKHVFWRTLKWEAHQNILMQRPGGHGPRSQKNKLAYPAEEKSSPLAFLGLLSISHDSQPSKRQPYQLRIRPG
jgi:hypothetical protein